LDIKEKIKNIPDSPGVYMFRGKESDIIYIGKAGSIRKRLRTHLLGSLNKNEPARHDLLRQNIADIDFICTPDAATALLLEAALIKRYNPKFNVLLKDDKSYPRLKLSVEEEYPRLIITRKIKSDGALYFGPYTNAKLLRKGVKFLKRAFPLRTCRKMPKAQNSKGCLDIHIGQCIGPCVSDRKEDYQAIVDELKLFLEGQQDKLLNSLAEKMDLASRNKDYEKAAKIRDRISALSSISQKNTDKKQVYAAPAPVQCGRESEQLEELRTLLGLSRVPDTIEAFDVSNTSGKEATGSMVCFKGARPYRNSYMHFQIKTIHVIDDYSMMREIISRRYRKLIAEQGVLPNLIIIDGGKGHLAAAKIQLRALRIINVPVIGIAKNPDKIYLHEKKDPILLGKFSKALLLCQNIRDEAHRFAVTYHRLLRSRKTRSSELDKIKGIGFRRKAELIKYFGSLDNIKQADIAHLKKVDFINEKEAKAVYDYFRIQQKGV
jgi:excinuclease ABC subunit C